MIELSDALVQIQIPVPAFTHLRRLTDAGGLYEHAEGATPRRGHAYCLDDVARGLIVVCREPAAAELDDLREQYLSFVLAAQEPDGRFHNRRHPDLSWPDSATVEDCWGRGLWSLGTAVARAPQLRERALGAFDRSAGLRSPHRRSMAFAALGAAEVLAVLPRHGGARALIAAAAVAIGRPVVDKAWPWPEPRLSYANAALPDALLAAGAALSERPRWSRMASACSVGCSTGRPGTVGCQSCRRPGGGRGRPGRVSTSSRSRRPRSPMPAPGRT